MVAAFLMVAILLPFTLPSLLAQSTGGGAGERRNLRGPTGTIQTRAQKGYVQLVTEPSYGSPSPVYNPYPYVFNGGGGGSAGDFKLSLSKMSFDLSKGDTQESKIGIAVPPGTTATVIDSTAPKSGSSYFFRPPPSRSISTKITASKSGGTGPVIISQDVVEVTYAPPGSLDDQAAVKKAKLIVEVRSSGDRKNLVSTIGLTFTGAPGTAVAPPPPPAGGAPGPLPTPAK